MCEPDNTQIKLMTIFVGDNQNTLNNIKSAIDNGDIMLAYRIVHTLKTGAGFIGKQGLMEAARVVERSLKHGEALFTEEQMNALEQELCQVLEELAPLRCEPDENVNQDEYLGMEETIALFNRLAILLDSGDPDCLELISNLKCVSGTKNLIKQIESFDFELANETLAVIRRNLEN